MPLRNPADLLQSLMAKASLMGLDLGTRTIGVAVSNPERTLASPRETIRRTKLKNDLPRLLALIDAEQRARAARPRVSSRPISSRRATSMSCCGTSACRPSL
jgi:hypothetical protein